MKFINTIIILIIFLNNALGQQPALTQQQTEAQLAVSFYNSQDYDKAIPLLKQIYDNSGSDYYYRLYMLSLIELERFEAAEKDVRKEINSGKNSDPAFFVYLGYILESQNRNDEANEAYSEAIEKIQPSEASYQNTANAFLQFSNYEFAEKTYLRGEDVLPDVSFSYELARIYSSLRRYDQMMDEYLNMIRQDERQLARVETSLASVMRLDVDDELRNEYRTKVLKRIQSEPNILAYNRLLIWFLLQEKNFAGALRQTLALDRRTGEEDVQIIRLGQMALNNRNYADAQNAYEYLLGKGDENPYYRQAFVQNIHASYLHYTNESGKNTEEGKKLVNLFENGFKFLGYNNISFNLILEFAHLQAFYLNNKEKAVEILEKGLSIPRLKPEQSGMLKTEMADINVFGGDPWEATLLYSQVIEDNKDNSLGDDVKLKKAKLAYYLGNFSWAKAQLDVIKASTSKLTANDAMELSFLIGNNLNTDTTSIPLTMFATADMLFFQNRVDDAMTVLNNLQEKYPYNSLVDDILFRKSKIETEKQNYSQAAEYLEQIVHDFSYESLADDALFALAELYNYHLNEKGKAKDLYRQMLVDYPGSVFVDESRSMYRELRELYPDNEIKINKEDSFMEGTKLQ